jgi:uncharacterized membrane protein
MFGSKLAVLCTLLCAALSARADETLEQGGGANAPSETAGVKPNSTLIACKGYEPPWSMELGMSAARLTPSLGAQQSLRGKLTEIGAFNTYAWRGPAEDGSGDVVALVLEGACSDTLSGERSLLTARVSLPDGSVLAGCCRHLSTSTASALEPQTQPPPAVARSERVRAPTPSTGETATGLLPVGTKVKLRQVDGPTVPLRKSARISSGNILAKMRAGEIATVEQAIAREGTQWYFLAFSRQNTKGWVMGDLVESLSPVALAQAPAASMMGDAPAIQVPSLSNPDRIEALTTAIPRTSGAAPKAVDPNRKRTTAGDQGPVFDDPLAPVSETWWRDPLPQLPLIDACLQKAKLQGGSVIKLSATPDGGRQIFLRDALFQRITCTVRPGQPPQVRALDVHEPFPHVSATIFTRAPGNPFSGDCYSNQRLTDPSHHLIGWLSHVKPGKRCR